MKSVAHATYAHLKFIHKAILHIFHGDISYSRACTKHTIVSAYGKWDWREQTEGQIMKQNLVKAEP